MYSPKQSVGFYIICLLVVLICTISTAAMAQETDPKPVVLSYYLSSNGKILLTARLDGKEAVTLAVDTGSGYSLTSNKVAVRLGWAPVKQPPTKGKAVPNWQRIGNFYLPVKRLEIGELTLNHVSLCLPDDDSLLSSLASENVDGILGCDLLSKYAVFFDFPQQKIMLWKNGHLSAQARNQLGLQNAFSVPMTTDSSSLVFCVPVSLNATKEQLFTIDTGANLTSIPTKEAQRLILNAILHFIEHILDTGAMKAEITTASMLSIGGYTVRNPLLECLPQNRRILGMDFLAQHYLLLDFPQRRMYFKSFPQTSVSLLWASNDYNLPETEVTLSDGKMHRFTLDPAMATFMDSNLAKTLPGKQSVPSENNSAVPQSLDSSARLANGKLTREFIKFTLNDLKQHQGFVPGAEGCLGWNFVRYYALRLDYSKKQLALISPGCLAGTDQEPKNAIRLPLLIAPDGCAVPMLVDGKPTLFALSILNSYTTLQAKSLIAKLHPESVLEEMQADGKSRTLRLHTLRAGKIIWNDPIVTDASAQSDSEINVLGADFLQRYRIIIDFPGAALYLEPDPNYHEKPGRGTGPGFSTVLDGEGKQFVTGIGIPSSAQEAGMQIGDEIIAIDGLPVATTPMDKLAARTKQPVGTPMTVTIRRKGEAQPRQLRLQIRKLL